MDPSWPISSADLFGLLQSCVLLPSFAVLFALCNIISHAHIDAISVEGASKGAIVVAAQDPADEHHQHLVEEEASQDANITPVSYTTDQGKPRLHFSYYFESITLLSGVYVCAFKFHRNCVEPTCINISLLVYPVLGNYLI